MTSRVGTIDDVVSNSVNEGVDLLTDFLVRGAQLTGLAGVLFGINEALTYGLDEISSLFAFGGAAVISVAQAYRNWYASIGPITYEDAPVRRSTARSGDYGSGKNPNHNEMVAAYGFKTGTKPESEVRQYSQAKAATERRANTRAATGLSYADLFASNRKRAPGAKPGIVTAVNDYMNRPKNVIPMRRPVERSTREQPALLAAVDSYADRQREVEVAHKEELQIQQRMEDQRFQYAMRAFNKYDGSTRANSTMDAMMACAAETRTKPKVVVDEPTMESLGDRIAAVEERGLYALPSTTYLAARSRPPRQQHRPQPAA